MIDCGVRGRGQLSLSRQPLWSTALGTGGAPFLQLVLRLTQPSTLHGMVKWVSAFGLSINNKWRWWMWMVAAICQRTHSPSQLAWSEGWRPPRRSVYIHQINRTNSRNGFRPDDSTINIGMGIIVDLFAFAVYCLLYLALITTCVLQCSFIRWA